MKKVLISGSTGYLGSYLKRKYEESGCIVKTIGRSNCDYICDFSEGKLDDEIASHLNLENFECFIHTAAQNENYCKVDDIPCYRVNVEGTKIALEYTRKSGINNFIYLSTFHVYGNPIGYIDEDVLPNPKNDYGLTHFLSEKIVEMYSSEFGINGLIVRPSNIYSDPSININRWSIVPNCFCKELIESNKITLKSSGLQKRNFVSIDSVSNDIINNQGRNGIIHSYGLDTRNILSIAKEVLKVANKSFGINGELIIDNKDSINAEKEFKYGSKYIKRDSEVNMGISIRNIIKHLIEHK